ncbi:MAG: 3'-5' exonuclease, partial [Pseudomonadota bacterium]|nr:3'-5' exonuclease [Pseudomonadota bacterium]
VGWQDRSTTPGTADPELEVWLGLAELLLTRDGAWRKPGGIKVGNGFPPPGSGTGATEKARLKEMKTRMQSLLRELEGEEEFRRSLHALRGLPLPAYSDKNWAVLEALFRVLLRAAQQLKVVIGNRGEMDFAEAALRAGEALGGEEAPTDLALRLDYQIRHLLVDEFQDTSQNQFTLFERLTAGWERGDGRTLFLVGDPMQSIYRFREAEVGLFLQAREHGIGEIELEFLRLKVNFRSRPGIVDWVNESFPGVLPPHSDPGRGAVSYAPFEASKCREEAQAVTIHPFVGGGRDAEAARVVEIIRRRRVEAPDAAIAVLVRARSHLGEITAALDAAHRERGRGLAYEAVEITPLDRRQWVLDLLALTRALLHPADRIAWLALLRAPFCGLTLEDLYRLAGENRDAVLPKLLREAAVTGTLGEDGMCRLARVLPVLEAALAARGRRPLRQWVEGTWIALGGPACIDSAAGLEDAEAFLRLLERQEGSPEAVDATALAEQMGRLYAQPEAGAPVKLMTIHKAKGLQFDTVIVPGLGERPRNEEQRLLHWLEQSSETGGSELLFGPIHSAEERSNPTSAYIRELEKEKGEHEAGRLLYVAVTRAEQRLHLLGRVAADNEGAPREPPARTLLRHLWPAVRQQFIAAAGNPAAATELAETAAEVYQRPRLRLPAAWCCPQPPTGVDVALPEAARSGGAVEFDWAGEIARLSGTVAHRLLQHLAERGAGVAIDHYAPAARRMLLQAGVAESQLEPAAERVMSVLRNTVQDRRGSWILSCDHREAECEAAVTAEVAGNIHRLVVDRTFIDADGLRWVIDYKTGAHEGGDIEAFLDREQTRYREQLEIYARAFAALEARLVRMGLYFPLLRGWREWPLAG